MITLIKNNYIKKSGSGDTFNINMDPLPTKFDNHFIESCRAAEEIYSLKQGKFHLMYSGGIDSEHALSVFLSLGLEVVPVIVRLNNNYNKHDIDYAFKFCKHNNINPIVIDVDFDIFVKSGKMLELAKQFKCGVHQRLATASALERLDGTVIICDNEPHIKLDQTTGKWNFEIAEDEYSYEYAFKHYGVFGTPNWGNWTAEMTISFLIDERIQDLARNKFMGRLGSESSKHYVYNRHSNLNLEVRQKYTGYEIIEKSKIFQHESFVELEKYSKTVNGLYKKDYFEMVNGYV